MLGLLFLFYIFYHGFILSRLYFFTGLFSHGFLLARFCFVMEPFCITKPPKAQKGRVGFGTTRLEDAPSI